MSINERPHGVRVYPMPESVTGPVDRYALLLRLETTGVGACMVHTEGVAYLVNDDHPWVWDDHDHGCPSFTVEELMDLANPNEYVDLADWVRVFGARLESNFHQIHEWAQAGPCRLDPGLV